MANNRDGESPWNWTPFGDFSSDWPKRIMSGESGQSIMHDSSESEPHIFHDSGASDSEDTDVAPPPLRTEREDALSPWRKYNTGTISGFGGALFAGLFVRSPPPPDHVLKHDDPPSGAGLEGLGETVVVEPETEPTSFGAASITLRTAAAVVPLATKGGDTDLDDPGANNLNAFHQSDSTGAHSDISGASTNHDQGTSAGVTSVHDHGAAAAAGSSINDGGGAGLSAYNDGGAGGGAAVKSGASSGSTIHDGGGIVVVHSGSGAPSSGATVAPAPPSATTSPNTVMQAMAVQAASAAIGAVGAGMGSAAAAAAGVTIAVAAAVVVAVAAAVTAGVVVSNNAKVDPERFFLYPSVSPSMVPTTGDCIRNERAEGNVHILMSGVPRPFTANEAVLVGDLFRKSYNFISAGCEDIYRREMTKAILVNQSLVSLKGALTFLDSQFLGEVECYGCPSEDPLVDDARLPLLDGSGSNVSTIGNQRSTRINFESGRFLKGNKTTIIINEVMFKFANALTAAANNGSIPGFTSIIVGSTQAPELPLQPIETPSASPSILPLTESSMSLNPTNRFSSEAPSALGSTMPSVNRTVTPVNSPTSSPTINMANIGGNTTSFPSQTSPSASARPSNTPGNQKKTPIPSRSLVPSAMSSPKTSNFPSEMPVSPLPSMLGLSDSPTLLASARPSVTPGNPTTSPSISAVPTLGITNSRPEGVSISNAPSVATGSTPEPTAKPSTSPTTLLDVNPGNPTLVPLSNTPTSSPIHSPTEVPSPSPTVLVSARPSITPGNPTAAPLLSNAPSAATGPTVVTSISPTIQTSVLPSIAPGSPTQFPSFSNAPPGLKTTQMPSSIPSPIESVDSILPSHMPSTDPSGSPTVGRSQSPSITSGNPTLSPSLSIQPVVPQTTIPSGVPSSNPTSTPSLIRSVQPSGSPTIMSILLPTTGPSPEPTSRPGSLSTTDPTSFPTPEQPSLPTVENTISPTPASSVPPLPSPILSLAPSYSPTLLPTPGPSSSPESNPTRDPTSGPTPIPTTSTTPANPIPTQEPRVVPTPSPTITPSTGTTIDPTPEPSLLPTRKPKPGTTPLPTVKITISPTPRPTFATPTNPILLPTPGPTLFPTSTLTPAPNVVAPPELSTTDTPSSLPSLTSPLPGPTSLPTLEITISPTPVPTRTLSTEPTQLPTPAPTLVPTPGPTSEPSLLATNIPTPEPTSLPTVEVTLFPTSEPMLSPSETPTLLPSASPTIVPTPGPTLIPSPLPISEPMITPTANPISLPTNSPTLFPTPGPTSFPSKVQTFIPSPTPTLISSSGPTVVSTINPTPEPTPLATISPTNFPTPKPSLSPSMLPTLLPSPSPILDPTPGLTLVPSRPQSTAPISQQTFLPSAYPISDPTPSPTPSPTQFPTPEPTIFPSEVPTHLQLPSASLVPTLGRTFLPSTTPTHTANVVAPSELMTTEMPSRFPFTLFSETPSFAPSKSPTISSNPSGSPSDFPSSSKSPSTIPSNHPSVINGPTQGPTGIPSISAIPSSPTFYGSISAIPSIFPSDAPSRSVELSSSPPSKPSESHRPAQFLISAPSRTVVLTSSLSETPTKSLNPSGSLSDFPSSSKSPSTIPSNLPSVSNGPFQGPSDFSSISTIPSAELSFQGSISAISSVLPSDATIRSADPIALPSSKPSESYQPSQFAPSRSVVPSSSPSKTPSQSLNPSGSPSEILSSSKSPSTIPSNLPSESNGPSQGLSEIPSTSANPSSVPSFHARFGAIPSVLPSNAPLHVLSNTPSRMCTHVKLDFSTSGDNTALHGGEYVKYEWLKKYGLTISSNPARGGIAPNGHARIFNTENKLEDSGSRLIRSPHRYCGSDGNPWVDNGDPGRGVDGRPGSPGQNCESQGNAIIIQNGNIDSVDASPNGGELIFEFEPPVAFFDSLAFLNMDSDDSITVFYSHSRSRVISVNAFGRGSFQIVNVTEYDVEKISVDITSIRAITDLKFCFFEPLSPPPQIDTLLESAVQTSSFWSRQIQVAVEEVSERDYLPSCSQGLFGINNFNILPSNGNTVTFMLKHRFCPNIEIFVMWFKHEEENVGRLSCHQFNQVRCSKHIDTKFEASCNHGRATIHLAAVDEHRFFQNISLSNDLGCIDTIPRLAEAGFNKCYWVMDIPCGGMERDGVFPSLNEAIIEKTYDFSRTEVLRDLEKQIQIERSALGLLTSAKEDYNVDCEIALDSSIYRIPVENCNVPDFDSSIRIINQGLDSVTFTVHQMWNSCQTNRSDSGFNWFATDYVALDNEIHCDTARNTTCGDVVTYTARCENWDTVIDLYIFNESGLCAQSNDALLVPPLACDLPTEINIANICHFRYLLHCSPVKCEGRRPTRRYLKGWI